MPGGCVIGDRPVELHLKGLEYLGADVKVGDGGNINIEAGKGGTERIDLHLTGRFGSTALGA